MARNDYMNAPVEMRAVSTWTGREGKVRRGDRITVTEARARELEGYQRTQTRRMNIDGTTTEPGQPMKVKARAVRIHDSDGKGDPRSRGETKGGPSVHDKGGRTDKGEPTEQTEDKRDGDHQQDSGPGASPAAQARAQELGIDLADVTGTGAHGRITKPDVDTAAERLKQAPPKTGDAQLDRFTADLRECTYGQLYEQRELYAQEGDTRYLSAIDAEIAHRDGEG